jgi:hypothetical protein
MEDTINNTYDEVIELAESYAEMEMSSLGDLIGSLCDCIRMYDGGFGDMPQKKRDLDSACLWVLQLILNDLEYEEGEGWVGDVAEEKREWLLANIRFCELRYNFGL